VTATARTRGPVLAVLPMIQRQARRIASGILLGGLALVLLENLVRSPGQFVSVLLLGITLGSIYALVALGFALGGTLGVGTVALLMGWESFLRITSPVPITSCQRASTSPRSREPLRIASSTSRCAPA